MVALPALVLLKENIIAGAGSCKGCQAFWSIILAALTRHVEIGNFIASPPQTPPLQRNRQVAGHLAVNWIFLCRAGVSVHGRGERFAQQLHSNFACT